MISFQLYLMTQTRHNTKVSLHQQLYTASSNGVLSRNSANKGMQRVNSRKIVQSLYATMGTWS